MLVYLLIPLLTLSIWCCCELIVKKKVLIGKNNTEKILTCYDGIQIFICVSISFILLHDFDMLTSFKLTYFLTALFNIFIVCFIDDLIGDRKIYTNKLTVHSVIKIGVVILPFYMNYCLNEEYWMLKGLLTFLFIDIFSKVGLGSNKTIKVTLIYFLILGIFYLRWTQDLFIVAVLVIISFKALKGFKVLELGKNGAGLIGMILGLISCEAFSISLSLLIAVNFLLLIFRYREIEFSGIIIRYFHNRQCMIGSRSNVKMLDNKYNK